MKDDKRLQGSESSKQQDQNPMEGYDHTDRNFERPNSDVDSDKQNVSDAQSKIKGKDLSADDEQGRKLNLSKERSDGLDLDAE